MRMKEQPPALAKRIAETVYPDGLSIPEANFIVSASDVKAAVLDGQALPTYFRYESESEQVRLGPVNPFTGALLWGGDSFISHSACSPAERMHARQDTHLPTRHQHQPILNIRSVGHQNL